MKKPGTGGTGYHLWIIAAACIFIAIMPVSAISAVNGTVIAQGGAVFIGEEGLNVTHAMNQAYYRSTLSGAGTGGIGTRAENNSYPRLTIIGWWAPEANLYTSSPSRVIDLGVNRRYAQMTVAPSNFVGYTGNWYLLNASGARPAGASGDTCLVFTVQDPSLDLKIWDYNQNTDMTGKAVPQGEKLGFRIDTNMYPAVDSRYRSNVIDDSITGLWAVPYTAGDVEMNNLLYNHATGTWTNGTYLILTNPDQPCCPIYAEVYTERFSNFSSYNEWMTWSEGKYGCRKMVSSTYFWNQSKGWLYYNYTTCTAPYDSGLDLEGRVTTLSYPGDYDYCMNGRFPVAATDGYIDLKVKDESNAQINALYNASAVEFWNVPGPNTVMKNFVDNQPFFWGTGTASPVHLNANELPYDGHVWNTGALDSFSQYAYPVGTYTVCAESRLNRMKENYRQGGADYTGKTVSHCYTITLVTDSVRIETNKDSVVRSKTFSTTITGRPGTYYYLWVRGTSGMTGKFNDQPPMIVLNQEGVFMDPYNPTNLTYPVGQYQYQNGGGRKIHDDVADTKWTWNGTRCYAKIRTSTSGTRTIEWLTTNWTKNQKFTISIEQQFPVGSAYNTGTYKSDQADIMVEKGAVTIAAAGDQAYDPMEEIRFTGTNTETYRTYLFITGSGLKPNGSRMQSPDPWQAEVVSGDPTTFLKADVYGDNTWSVKWITSGVNLTPGNYTVWAVSQPFDRWTTRHSDTPYGKAFITINSLAPVADFSATPLTGTAPLTVRFTDTSAKSPASWKWIFGDGSTVNNTKQNPVHTFAKAGTYNVTLKSMNAYGKNIETKNGYITVDTAPPTVTAISPASGKWGKTVWITNLTGTGFAEGAMVYLEKSGSSRLNATKVTVISPTNITCKFSIPLYTAVGPWDVRVNNPDGKSGMMPGAFTVRAPGAPTVTGITPDLGAQGTTVPITYLAGTGFALEPAPAVQLIRDGESIDATDITVINPNRMTCSFEIPSTATIGCWTVRVTNADGQYGTKAEAFTIRALPTVTAITPDTGNRGTSVEITSLTGTGFDPDAKVSLTRTGSSALAATSVVVVSPEEITCTFEIPAGAGIGPWDVTVENPDGSGTKAGAFTINTPEPPTITDITPASGIRGTTVQIANLSGSGFASDPIPAVHFIKDGDTITATNITVVDPETITCTLTISPYAVTGAWDVRVTNADTQYGEKTGAFTVET